MQMLITIIHSLLVDFIWMNNIWKLKISFLIDKVFDIPETTEQVYNTSC
jgi:hypothetical protein